MTGSGHHPEIESLVAVVMGEADVATASRVEELTKRDTRVSELLADLRSAVDELTATRSFQVPEHVRRAALDLYTPPTSMADTLRTVGAQLAHLVYSLDRPMLAGLRSGSVSHYLRFTVGVGSVDVSITPINAAPMSSEGGQLRLRCQFEPGAPFVGAQLSAKTGLSGKIVSIATVGEDGHVVMSLPPGVYDLTVTTSKGSWLLPMVEVG